MVHWCCAFLLQVLSGGLQALSCLAPILLLTSLLALYPGTASATTLREAMAQAYRNNPRLDAERAQLRATDEDVPRALSGWRPQISGSSDYGHSSTKTNPITSSHGKTNAWGYSLNVTQPVFDGFRTTNKVSQAEANVRAGREDLRLVEQEVLLDAVTVYADVLRDRAVQRLREHNVDVLSEELEAARARRRVREITVTDVAQARARRARAVSDLDSARAQLKASLARYKQIIGSGAGGLARAPYRSKLLPSTLRRALEIAEREHPTIISAKYREQAARQEVDIERGELLPNVRLEASYSRRYDGSATVDDEEDARITGRLTMPFYQGGEVHARIRQAKHRHVRQLQEIEKARRQVEAGVMAAWSSLSAARSRLNSDHVQLQAARMALEGVREEEKVGQRTIIEMLNAEQEFLDAGVALETTRRDLTVAAYQMLAALGRLNAERLSLMSEVYDPKAHYAQVREQWFGWTITGDERRPLRDGRGKQAGEGLAGGQDMISSERDGSAARLGGPARSARRNSAVARDEPRQRSTARKRGKRRKVAKRKRRIAAAGGRAGSSRKPRKAARYFPTQAVRPAIVPPVPLRGREQDASLASTGLRGAVNGYAANGKPIIDERAAPGLALVGKNNKISIIRGGRID